MGGIIWLASYPKSGNTWTRMFIENLMRDPRGGVDINDVSIANFYESSPIHYERLAGRPPADLTPEEIAALRPKVQAAIASSTADSVFVKTHCALLGAYGHPQIDMNLTAAAIYLVRNPLDVVVSSTNYFEISIDQAIDQLAKPLAVSPTQTGSMHAIYGSWTENVESWTSASSDGLLVLKYEDLIDRPIPTFGRLAAFLGLTPGRARLERAVKASSFHRLRKQEQKHGFSEESGRTMFRTGKSGQWREALTADQARRVVDEHRIQMERFGYVPDDV